MSKHRAVGTQPKYKHDQINVGYMHQRALVDATATIKSQRLTQLLSSRACSFSNLISINDSKELLRDAERHRTENVKHQHCARPRSSRHEHLARQVDINAHTPQLNHQRNCCQHLFIKQIQQNCHRQQIENNKLVAKLVQQSGPSELSLSAPSSSIIVATCANSATQRFLIFPAKLSFFPVSCHRRIV